MSERGEIGSVGNAVAERLLASIEHARFACPAPDGTPQLNARVGSRNRTTITLAGFATAANLRGTCANPAASFTADSITRIVFRPSWVGVIGCETRVPRPRDEVFA